MGVYRPDARRKPSALVLSISGRTTRPARASALTDKRFGGQRRRGLDPEEVRDAKDHDRGDADQHRPLYRDHAAFDRFLLGAANKANIAAQSERNVDLPNSKKVESTSGVRAVAAVKALNDGQTKELANTGTGGAE